MTEKALKELAQTITTDPTSAFSYWDDEGNAAYRFAAAYLDALVEIRNLKDALAAQQAKKP